MQELHPTISVRDRRKSSPNRRLSGLAIEAGTPVLPISQGIPKELGNLTKEIIFILVCSSGQLLFAALQGNVNVNQQTFQTALGLKSTQLPWLNGSFLVALGLSVIIAGSLTDLAPPRLVIVSSYLWLTLWDIVGCFCLTPSRNILYFLVRAFQGFAVGVLVSGSMSILGRVYNPGMRKTRVFSAMAAMAPFGFWLGALQGGAFSYHLEWIFGSTAIISGLLCVAAYYTIPHLPPQADVAGGDAPSIRNFDWKGACCIGVSFICLLFGLTQGSVANWAPYTYILIILGFLALTLFAYVESRVARPLIPNRLWKTKGFTPLMVAYFLGFGGFVGAWQFYAMQFFLRIQHKSAITVALYLLPNAIMGVLATFIVSRLLHIVPGHYIYIASMLAFALGPAFFLPQTPTTTYWALSMPGIALATFGPDLSFAAASIFITSNVARSYQGAAGSLLVTIQNLSSAIMTAVSDAIGSQVDSGENGEIGLQGLKAIWWFAMGACLVGAVVTGVAVRIPKEEEKEHVT
ncbi:MFS general substrate transporter [Teratosphaeria nubilosa]|uniref:MFS general substrate transporter n=1 Tax=Teratosphaeria nubilosa TaxID=161662 RepID=A0A6G1LH37_9PEZI|nr:MFS general substrate transporter [Teratosphaeria nubilosa]